MKWYRAAIHVMRERLSSALLGSAILWALEHFADKTSEHLIQLLALTLHR